jgi:ATP-dependent protease ClpP protease subunit
MKLIKYFILILMSVHCLSVTARIILIDNQTILISEIIKPGDDLIFNKLAQKKITTLFVQDCKGGLLLEAMNIAEQIHFKKINTKLNGFAGSACAYIFLAGKGRSIDADSKNNHILMLHGGIGSISGQPIDKSKNILTIQLLEKYTDVRFNEIIKSIIYNTKYKNEGIYFVKNKIYSISMYCSGDLRNIGLKKCEALNKITMESENIINNKE